MFKKFFTVLAAVSMISVASFAPAFAADGDNEINTKIVKELHERFSDNTPSGVKVETTDGIVYLRGHVKNFADKTTVESIAKSTNGVSNVVNELNVHEK